ncbi:MAG: hypothetical protein A3K22_03255 [Deltaproteobacteria bacterium RBG_16_42_7]|nr:MAG: hypothetical protein A3K22_03255 [Deltaproteobacteria bacterium RBG_16_42_7]
MIELGRRKMLNMFKGMDLRIFILSVWMLFLELFLIRWVSTEIRIFAYVNNLVLLACFIGIGLGCYFSNRKTNPLFVIVFLSILIVAVKSRIFTNITDLFSGFSDSDIWYYVAQPDNLVPALKGIVLTVFMFSLIAGVFFPLGQLLGAMFNNHQRTIVAYSINIFGSIIGIWLFSLLSFIYTTPLTWFIVSTLLGLIFLQKKVLNILFFIMFFLISSFLMFIPSEKDHFAIWSPYQKLTVYQHSFQGISNGYAVQVNNVGYMSLFNISEEFIYKNFHKMPVLQAQRRFNQYELPYILKENANAVLIVGAGGGNDVAGALRQRIKEIDAVEIDPAIYEIGLLLHPERPYNNKRTHVYIDDARSFLKKINKQYDVVSFGLLDAHTTSSNYNNVRLDHYVYTLESFKEAKNLLKTDGILTIVFNPAREWIVPRIYNLLKEAFGNEPLAFRVNSEHSLFGGGGIMYVVNADPEALSDAINRNQELKRFIEENKIYFKPEANRVKITTDDWPYLYLEGPAIPKMYLCVMASLIILFFAGARGLFVKITNINMHFLFLGAAFLLLEFQNISKSSLLFGSTWIVNAYMITAILLLILLANILVYYCQVKNIKLFYCLLWISVLAIYFIPLGSLNISNYYLKATLIAIFLNVPIFFAGVIFINSFSNYPQKDIALGSNLLGACLGGLLESLSFVVGIKALLILVFFIYLLSYLFGRRVIFVKST